MTALDTIRTHVAALDDLEYRMTYDDGTQLARITARAKEARSILRGMGDYKPTLGELHTTYYKIYLEVVSTVEEIADVLETSDKRAKAMIDVLTQHDLITETPRGWDVGVRIASPQDANRAFNDVLPGLSIIDLRKSAAKEHTGPRDNMPPTLADAAPAAQPTKRAAQPESEPTMALKSTKNLTFTKSDTPSDSKKAGHVVKMVETLRKHDGPVPFTYLCESVGAKYPQDVEAAMFSLESLGLVQKYTVKDDAAKRPMIAFEWVGGDGPFGSTSSTSKGRSRSSSASKGKSASTAKSQESQAETSEEDAGAEE